MNGNEMLKRKEKRMTRHVFPIYIWVCRRENPVSAAAWCGAAKHYINSGYPRKTCQTLALLAGPSQLEYQSACPKLESP